MRRRVSRSSSRRPPPSASRAPSASASIAEAAKVHVSSIFSWREKEFAAAYADKAPAAFASRSPIERAVIAYVLPKLLPTEKEFLEKNSFQLVYTPFDWTLNDLTGRGGR